MVDFSSTSIPISKTVQMSLPSHCVKSTSRFQSRFCGFLPLPSYFLLFLIRLENLITVTAAFLLPSKSGPFKMLKYSAKLLKELCQKNIKY